VDSDFGSFQALVSSFFDRSAPNPMYRYNSAIPTWYSMVNETKNINQLFRDLQIPVSVNALDRPEFDRTQLCSFVNRSVVERLRP